MKKISDSKATTSGGAKLNRSETVTVRLDPKLNYLCELAARAQRRTKSSFIEWAVAEVLGLVTLPDVREPVNFEDWREVTLRDRAASLWHVDEADRVIMLALVAPALLNHEEQLIWRLVRENGSLWRGHYNRNDEWVWTASEDDLIKGRLRAAWPDFVEVARGEKSEDVLPMWNKKRITQWDKDSDLDDDVPF
jgi:predicted transcriptional regulator